MSERLLLLPGWGLGTAPLAGLLARLEGELPVEVVALPDFAEPDWLERLDTALPQDAWLAGWSLGGMLAVELAARRQRRCPGVISLASNACFVAREDWPAAMAPEVFAAFYQGCAEQPEATLKRFALLCGQGAADARALGRNLLAQAPGTQASTLLAGLDVLASLDTRPALQSYVGPSLHLFGEADALVPVQASQSIWQPTMRVESACHAFPVERADEVAAAILTFIREQSA
ncbi:alpha/beta fold hydrolase [Pseudomonas sp. LRF_L74]|uniref:alpha/beta fold hydrolase n=1 Tax=Pseudomonas sp. LRF_L74 TaxID=3369422 RepID=UPI003F5D90AD